MGGKECNCVKAEVPKLVVALALGCRMDCGTGWDLGAGHRGLPHTMAPTHNIYLNSF